MKRGKYQTSPKGVSSKAVALVLALVLTIGCVVGGTIAWLTDTSKEVKNTFTYGDINIDLTETKGTLNGDSREFKMVPGNTIAKDPKVTVEAGSEDCWLFVKIEESQNLDTYISYTVASGWTELTAGSGIYWCQAKAGDSFSVLANDEVIVNSSVNKTQMEAIKTADQPTLTFTAYAVQKDNVATAADAWAIANPTT